jgi:murein DD-endopeptidase MepM/ murein hydrolase activator NlpD
VAGQRVGKVGNSGASDLPHLHYHLQKGPDLAVNRAEGVVALFARYRKLAGGRETLVESGSPATGELVAGDAPGIGPSTSAPSPNPAPPSGKR